MGENVRGLRRISKKENFGNKLRNFGRVFSKIYLLMKSICYIALCYTFKYQYVGLDFIIIIKNIWRKMLNRTNRNERKP